MMTYLLILPVALLVAYSQIVVKWRIANGQFAISQSAGTMEYLISYLLDPVIMSAYVAALLASFAWLYVITKLPLAIAFPVYIGVTFCLVLIGGWFFLSEIITTMRLLAIFLILSGIILGVKN